MTVISKKIAQTIIALLEQQGQIENLPEVIEALTEYLESTEQQIVVESAVELDEQSLSQLKNILTAKLGFAPTLKQIVNPELLGGIRLQINDQLIDATVRAQLNDLFDKMH